MCVRLVLARRWCWGSAGAWWRGPGGGRGRWWWRVRCPRPAPRSEPSPSPRSCSSCLSSASSRSSGSAACPRDSPPPPASSEVIFRFYYWSPNWLFVFYSPTCQICFTCQKLESPAPRPALLLLFSWLTLMKRKIKPEHLVTMVTVLGHTSIPLSLHFCVAHLLVMRASYLTAMVRTIIIWVFWF